MQFSTRVVFFFKKYPAFLFAFLATLFCNRRRNLFQEKDDVMVLSTWQTNCLWEDEEKKEICIDGCCKKAHLNNPRFLEIDKGRKGDIIQTWWGNEREGESDSECSSCDKEERKQKKRRWWWWSNQIPKQFESLFPYMWQNEMCVQFGQKTEILSSNAVSGN